MLRIPQINKQAFRGLLAQHRPCEDGFFLPKDGQINFDFTNDDYSVTLNGESCPVRSCRVSAIPFNRTWPGKQRDLSQTERASFITFSSDESVRVCVKTSLISDAPVIRPLKEEILPSVDGDKITFELTHPGTYVLEPCGSSRVLHIFFNPVKDYPDAEKATYYFGPGLHFPGTINLRNNDTVYIDSEAIVFGSLYTTGAENVRIFGGGILDNSFEERIVEHCYENFTKGTLRIYNSSNFSIEDVILMNSSTWILSMFYCHNINIDNVKLVGHWRYNTDGIDIVNSSNVIIKNSFIRSFDDTVSIKGIYEYPDAVENITVDNCVLWCGWGYTCEIGVETKAAAFRNITFKNSCCIHVSGPALAIPNHLNSHVYSIRYENMSVEFQHYTLAQIYQQTDDMNFDEHKRPINPVLINLTNRKDDNLPIDVRCEGAGCTHDIEFEDIYVFTDKPDTRPSIIMFSEMENVFMSNIRIKNLHLNGEKQFSLDRFNTRIENIKNLTQE